MYGESDTETYSTMCEIGSQWELAVGLRKLKQHLIQQDEWGFDTRGSGATELCDTRLRTRQLFPGDLSTSLHAECHHSMACP